MQWPPTLAAIHDLVAVVFWLSTSAVMYAFAIYPLTVVLVGFFLGRRPQEEVGVGPHDSANLPSIAIIIAACNEVDSIQAGLEALEKAIYPTDKRETIVVTDDGSVDGTIEIVKRCASKTSLRHLHCPNRGKNICLDFVVQQTNAEVLVFKDATGLFASDALLRLASHFQDAQIGCVGGSVIFRDNGQIGATERRYWVIEQMLRRGTEVLGYLPSAAGGIHAMRRTLYRPVANDITRDMVDPIQAVVQGQRAIKDDAAICYEVPWAGVGDVYGNRIRVTKRAWAAIRYNASELWKAGRYSILFQLISHKVFRFLVWIPLLIGFFASVVLAMYSQFFLIVMLLQSLIYFVCGLSLWAAKRGSFVPVISFFGFLMLNLVAMADGTLRFFAGRRANTWKD